MNITHAINWLNGIIMNRFQAKYAANCNKSTSQSKTSPNNSIGGLSTGGFSTSFYSAIIAIAISGVSFSVSADRPAMDDPSARWAREEIEQAELRKAEAERAAQQAATHSPASQMMQHPVDNVEYQSTEEVLVLPPTEIQPGETINIKQLDSPRRGITMDAVRRELGQPIATSASVGQPPITHWTYPDRIVYFEYSRVLHVVAR